MNAEPSPPKRRIPGSAWRLVAVLVFLGLLLAAAEFSGLRSHFSLEFLRQKLSENLWSGLGVFIVLFAVGNLIQIPGWIFLAAAVVALGRTAGGLATYLAACLSCGATYFTIQLIGGNALRRLDSKLAARILGQLDARPIRSIILLRILFQTLPALNYALALSGVGFRKYMAGTLLGLPLPIMAYCIFFDYLGQLLIKAG